MNQDPYFLRKEVSNSDLNRLYHLLNPREMPDPTEAYRFGTLVDALITETERVNFFKRMVDDDAFDKETWDKALSMRDAFWNDPFCTDFMQGAEPQKVMIRDMPISYMGLSFELPVRCKWDIWRPNLGYGGDIKSTTAETQSQFEAAARYFRYDQQRAFYMDIAGAKYDVLIGISKKNLKIFKIFIKKGDSFYSDGFDKYSSLAFKYYLINQAA